MRNYLTLPARMRKAATPAAGPGGGPRDAQAFASQPTGRDAACVPLLKSCPQSPQQ
jgi:hypothetical protein